MAGPTEGGQEHQEVQALFRVISRVVPFTVRNTKESCYVKEASPRKSNTVSSRKRNLKSSSEGSQRSSFSFQEELVLRI